MLSSSSLQIINLSPPTKLNSMFNYVPSLSTYQTLCFAIIDISDRHAKKGKMQILFVSLLDRTMTKKKSGACLPTISLFLYYLF